jgi:hypothetical protein
MRVAVRFLCGAFIVLVLALFASAATVKAQAPPPCNGGAITFNNPTAFPVNICLQTVPPMPCIFVPAGLAAIVPVPVPTNVVGILSTLGINYPFARNPFPPPGFWVPSVSLPPTGNCFDVFYDPATCTVTVVFVGVPPCVNP